MRPIFYAAVGAGLFFAAPAMATCSGGNCASGPQAAIWNYPAQNNYCPAGLQPVILGGVICCGTPNRTGYQSHPVSRTYAAPAEPFVAYGKGYNDDGTGGY